MAARKQLWHPDEVRQKIQASQLINRLTTHALSDEPIMDSSQVTAACRLLNKAIPDLQAISVDGEMNHKVDGLKELLDYVNQNGKRIHD